MEAAISTEIPGYPVPPTMMFGARTRLMEVWRPMPECIYLPGFEVAPTAVHISASPGTLPAMAPKAGGRLWSRTKARIKSRINRSIPIERHPEKLVFEGRRWWDNNIAHILKNVVMTIRFIQDQIEAANGDRPEVHVVLPRRVADFTRRVYAAVGVPLIVTDGAVEGVVVDITPPPRHRALAGLTLNEDFPGYTTDTPTHLYISRKGRRELTNEAAVASMLAERGYQRVYFEDHPLPVQWSMIRNATDIVAVHGAALGNLIFRRPAPPDRPSFRLVEMFGAAYIKDVGRRDTAILGGVYCAVRGRVTPEVVRDVDQRGQVFSHYMDPFEVDPLTIEMALDYVARGGGQPRMHLGTVPSQP